MPLQPRRCEALDTDLRHVVADVAAVQIAGLMYNLDGEYQLWLGQGGVNVLLVTCLPVCGSN